MINEKSISDIVIKFIKFALGNVPIKVTYLIKGKTSYAVSFVSECFI